MIHLSHQSPLAFANAVVTAICTFQTRTSSRLQLDLFDPYSLQPIDPLRFVAVAVTLQMFNNTVDGFW